MQHLPFRKFFFVFGLALFFTAVLSVNSFAAPPITPETPVIGHSKNFDVLDAVLKKAILTAPSQAAWPDNDYARLLDLGDVTVQADGTVTAEYRATIKCFNQRARELAEVSLPYNSSYQSIRLLKAQTIKKDGTVLEVKPEDVRSSSPYSDYLMYDDAQSVGFSFPGVADDCVIDYTWREVTRPLLMPGQFWEYWRFNGIEPVVLSRYTVHAPASKILRFASRNNAPAPVVTASANGKTKSYLWEMRDNKPIAPEPAAPDSSEIFASVQISSLTDWQDVARWYESLAKPQEKPTAAIRATVAKITAGKTTEAEKARACYDWVADQTRYVGLEFGLSAFRPHPAGEVHDKLYGDCKDKATLLISMLDAAGIKACPVLLKAEEQTPVENDLPNLNAFNHCIAQAVVDGKTVWLDATAETTAYGDIPESDRGAQAFVVRDGKGEFQAIPRYQAHENGTVTSATVTLKADGSAVSAVDLSFNGGVAQEMRAVVRAIKPGQQQGMMQQVTKRFAASGELKTFNLPAGNDKSAPYVINFTMDAPEYAVASGNLLLIPASPSLSGTENPFNEETRVFPVVQNDVSLNVTMTIIALPAGYSLASIPEDVVLTCAFQTYRRLVKTLPDGKSVSITETLTARPGRVAPKNYASLRAYYTGLAKTSRAKLVLQMK